MKFDLHIHSKYSYDSFLKPETIIKIARKKGLDGVAVTDHNTIKGGLKTAQINPYDDFEVIVGSEIKTEFGDVIGLFLSSEISSRIFDEVIDEIHSQDGISILAHPYRQYAHPEELLAKIDAVEGFNARSKPIHNQQAVSLAKQHSMIATGGSDSHCQFEIAHGYCLTNCHDLRNAFKKSRIQSKGIETNYAFSHLISFSSEILKKMYRKNYGRLDLV